MTLNNPIIENYFSIAIKESIKSKCKRLKVGCVVVKGYDILTKGYNHMPNESDDCECNNVSHDSVVHAEFDAIQKYFDKIQNLNFLKNSTIFITHSPCVNCAKLLVSIQPKIVYYLDSYRDLSGINILKEADIEVIQFINPRLE